MPTQLRTTVLCLATAAASFTAGFIIGTYEMIPSQINPIPGRVGERDEFIMSESRMGFPTPMIKLGTNNFSNYEDYVKAQTRIGEQTEAELRQRYKEYMHGPSKK